MARVTVDGVGYTLPTDDDLLLGELHDVERRFGGSLSGLGEGTKTLALLWIALCRNGGKADEAHAYLLTIRVGQLEFVEDDDAGPPAMAAEPPAPSGGASDAGGPETTLEPSGNPSSAESTA